MAPTLRALAPREQSSNSYAHPDAHAMSPPKSRLLLPPPERFRRIIYTPIRPSRSPNKPKTLHVSYVFELDDGTQRQLTARRAHNHGLSSIIHDYWNSLPHLARLQFKAFHEGYT